MQGKLISFSPLLINGVHSTFTGQNGVMYKFTVTLEADGKQYVGTSNSTKQQPSWKVGSMYNFDHVMNGEYSNIKGLKAVDAGNNFSGKKPDPSFSIQKCFEAAVECTLLFFELNQEYYKDQATEDKMLEYTYSHILGPVGTSEQKRWMNISGMRLALAKMRANGMFNKDDFKTLSEWLFAQAKAISDTMETVVKQTIESENKPQ